MTVTERHSHPSFGSSDWWPKLRWRSESSNAASARTIPSARRPRVIAFILARGKNERPRRNAAFNLKSFWSGQPDSNRRHQPWQGCTLPTELCPLTDAERRRLVEPPAAVKVG